MNRFLLWLTRNAPMKTIAINDEPYLQRYYMGQLFGRQVWLHRFLTSDSERHMHSYPWRALSIVLRGWYRERWFLEGYPREHAQESVRTLFSLQTVGQRRIHRIVEVRPNTWTLMIVGESRRSEWYFIDENGHKEFVEASPLTWWKQCQPRASNG